MKFALRSAVFAVLVSVGSALAVPAAADDAGTDATLRAQIKPARLIEFTGNREFLKTSARLRVWRGEVGYTLAIDAAGTPTSCALADEFRLNYVNDKLCEVLMKHHSFEPAQDTTGVAIAGQYEGLLNFLEMREKN